MTLWQIIPLAYLAVVTIPLVRIDWKTHKLPNAWVMPGYVALVIAWIGVWMTTGEYPMIPAISAAGYFTFMLLLSYGGGMGMGDVKLAGLLGWNSWSDQRPCGHPVAGAGLCGRGSGICSGTYCYFLQALRFTLHTGVGCDQANSYSFWTIYVVGFLGRDCLSGRALQLDKVKA